MSAAPPDPQLDYRLRARTPRSSLLDRHTRHTPAFILAGGRGERLRQLTERRAKPAVPMAGQLKIIDFPLSNCVNSGIRRIAVLTQYKAQSLIRHIDRGWAFLAGNLGEYVEVVPAQQRVGTSWYSGTADAVYQNLDIVRELGAEQVLILAGDHVYKMDYGVMLADHVAKGAAVTVACIEAPLEQARHFGVMSVDGDARIVEFHEKPADPRPLPSSPGEALVSMGIYVFNASVLIDALERDAADISSSHDFGRDVIPALIARGKAHAHRFADSCVNMVGERPYWRDVGTLDAYWEANMDLTHVVPELNLYDDEWPIMSLQPQLPPAKFVFDEDRRRGLAVDSVVASGCIVSGATIRRSMLFSKVRVGEGSLVEDSVILPNVVIGRDVVLRRVIVDKRCILPDGFRAGLSAEQDRSRFQVTDKGVTLITSSMLAAVGAAAVA